MVCQPVQQRTGQPLRSEHIGPLVERQVGGHKHRAPLVALTEDLEEQLHSGLRQGNEAQFVYDQQLQTGQSLLEVQQTSVVLASISSLTSAAAVVNPTDSPL